MLQAYILKEDDTYFKAPRVFIEDVDSHYTWAAATPTDKTEYGISLYWLKQKNKIQPIDIYKVKWVHPHLLKKIKQDLAISI